MIFCYFKNDEPRNTHGQLHEVWAELERAGATNIAFMSDSRGVRLSFNCKDGGETKGYVKEVNIEGGDENVQSLIEWAREVIEEVMG